MAKKNQRKGVLSDHQRKGKVLIPPFTAQLGPLREVSWVKRILPEVFWIALLQHEAGLRNGVMLARELAKSSREVTASNGLFASMSSFSRLGDDGFRNLRHQLAGRGFLFDLQKSISSLVGLYPESPLRSLFSQMPDGAGSLPLVKSIVSKLFDRASRDAVMAQSTFIYLALDAGVLKVREGLALADFPLVQDYPDTERSRQVAAMVRAAITNFFGEPLYEESSPWPSYFWNRGLELERCYFNLREEQSLG
jgi:hypothetical protein